MYVRLMYVSRRGFCACVDRQDSKVNKKVRCATRETRVFLEIDVCQTPFISRQEMFFAFLYTSVFIIIISIASLSYCAYASGHCGVAMCMRLGLIKIAPI